MLALLCALALAEEPPLPALQPGDVLFHQSRSSQAAAIAAATGSRYTHVGVVLEEGLVLEAVQPVKLTSVEAWVARGVDGHVAVRRPVVPLTEAERAELAAVGRSWLGRDYDLGFGWDDDRLYCSELVYKLFLAATGREIGERRAVREFHVEDPAILRTLEARGISLDQLVVSPHSQLVDSDLAPVL